MAVTTEPRPEDPAGGYRVDDEGRRLVFVVDMLPDDHREAYEELGVPECLLIAADAESPGPDPERPEARLLLLKLGEDGRYAKVAPDERGELPSEALGLSLSLDDGRLVARDTQTGKVYRTPSPEGLGEGSSGDGDSARAALSVPETAGSSGPSSASG